MYYNKNMRESPKYVLVKLARNKTEILKNEYSKTDKIEFAESCITGVCSMYMESDIKKLSGSMQDAFGIGNAIIIHEIDNLKPKQVYAVAQIVNKNETNEEFLSRSAECPIGEYNIVSLLCAVRADGSLIYGREKNYLRKINMPIKVKR